MDIKGDGVMVAHVAIKYLWYLQTNFMQWNVVSVAVVRIRFSLLVDTYNNLFNSIFLKYQR